MREDLVIGKFETKSGIFVYVRPLMHGDTHNLVDLFNHMGPESRYNRFLQPAEQVDIDRVWNEAEKITDLLNDGSFGLVAIADLPDQPDALVGAARYVKISSAQAEIAISVRDDMQGQGIGTNLMRLLIRHAGESGIDQLIGTIQSSNKNMWAMLSKLGYRLERQPEGTYCLVIIHVHEPQSRREDWLDAAADFSPEPQIIW